MNTLFKHLPIGVHFVTRGRRLAQKTSERNARYGSGPAYRFRAMEMAVPVPAGTTCPYMVRHYHQELS